MSEHVGHHIDDGHLLPHLPLCRDPDENCQSCAGQSDQAVGRPTENSTYGIAQGTETLPVEDPVMESLEKAERVVKDGIWTWAGLIGGLGTTCQNPEFCKSSL